MPQNFKIEFAAKPSRIHRIVLIFQETRNRYDAVPAEVAKAAKALAKIREFNAGSDELLLLNHGNMQWLFAGLGARKALDRQIYCNAIGRALAEMTASGGMRLDLIVPHKLPWPEADCAQWATEAMAMADYSFRAYKTGKKHPPSADAALVCPGKPAAIRTGIAAGLTVSVGIALARDLVNHPAAVAHPDFMTAQARIAAKDVGARIKVIRGDNLLRQGYEAIHTVGAAAEVPPALVALEYGRRRKGHPTIALVGKGVTFDSGGLDLKTSSGMALMKKDMGGSALVLGAFRAIAGLKLPVHLVAVIGLAENAVGPKSYRPGDIVRSKSGKTIEITNTDAEGRVVLADALALALTYRPTYMIDFATLTGACRVALGKDIMGLFCDDTALTEALLKAAANTGEALWPLPLWKPYRKKLDSPVADLVNAASDGFGGAITAALFLQEFAGDVAWAHIDCYAWSGGDNPLFPKGGNGIGVRLLTELVQSL